MPKQSQNFDQYTGAKPFCDYLPLLKSRAKRHSLRRRSAPLSGILKKAFLFASVLLFSLVFFLGQKLLYLHPSLSLSAETAVPKKGASQPASFLWQDIRSHYAGLDSQEGLAHWLWQRREEFHGLGKAPLARLQRSEETLRNYLDGPELRSTFSRQAFELQLQGTPVFTYERGMRRQSPHPLASVTKTFTAVAVLKLLAAHKVALDDDIAIYFPEVTSFRHPLGGVPIRVRDLLQHSSGISYRPSISLSLPSPYRRLSYPIARQFQEARKRFHYSNYNYYILAALVERVSKQAYDKFLQEQIFAPLHLQNTSISALSMGAAGLKSSVSDLAFFLDALFGREALLPHSLVSEMIRKPDYLKFQPELCYYGLGIRGQYHKGRLSSVYHTGLWKHTLAEMRYYVSERLALVHLSSPNYFRSPRVGSYRYQSVFLTEKYLKSLRALFAPARIPQNPYLVSKNR